MVKTILVVDDSELQRLILKDALEAYPCRVVGEAENGAEAVRLAAELSPDIVFLDIEMPGTTGVEALRAIKAAQPGVTVFMVTSIDASDVIDDCLMAGAEDYIRKDKLESLDARIGRFLRD
jgi:DNA-binding NarL/FixJ family response regulator